MSPTSPPVVAVAVYPPRGVADPRRAVVREIAHALKVADPSAIAAAASAMARLVPRGAALVPVPSSRGDTRANAALAAALARLVGGRVLDGLRRDPSRSQYALRAAGMPSLAASEMRLRWVPPAAARARVARRQRRHHGGYARCGGRRGAGARGGGRVG